MFANSPTRRRLLRTAFVLLLATVASTQAADGPEIPNPSFEEPELQPSPGFMTPGAPGHGEAMPILKWAFGYHSGICVEGSYHADGVSAADGHQMAFIQGEKDITDEASVPRNIFGGDVTGLQPGEEYEISWKQTGRASDIGTGAVRVVISKQVDPHGVVLLDREPVTTKGEWESKSVWFTATEPNMRLGIIHFIHEAGNPPEDPEITLFDDFKIRAGHAAD